MPFERGLGLKDLVPESARRCPHTIFGSSQPTLGFLLRTVECFRRPEVVEFQHRRFVPPSGAQIQPQHTAAPLPVASQLGKQSAESSTDGLALPELQPENAVGIQMVAHVKA